eukprot:CAMPEP_0197314322 /NCGR_PEP_ID=MMETSP0891-20130614/33284_1 /TAXON_ID=44058 ORGANISM="Aureoumbra lagunensis, Strain CCMP1510" /NCGR_SAMPLE_ID=MMETSP0891 /ASSEMBLY_ACC=CAM_ASM_000534 /LENGTH=260 /DNA_ID=CAMNT_0042802715 /DNA_START=123 /DNA_END=905 /DNA_ORIENTATION=-
MLLLDLLQTKSGMAQVESEFEDLWERVRREEESSNLIEKVKKRSRIAPSKRHDSQQHKSVGKVKAKAPKRKKFEFPEYIKRNNERERLVRDEDGAFVRPGDKEISNNYQEDGDTSIGSDAVLSTGSMDDWIVADHAVVAALDRKCGDEDSITSSQRWIYSGAELIRELRCRPASQSIQRPEMPYDDDTTSVVSRLSDATSAIGGGSFFVRQNNGGAFDTLDTTSRPFSFPPNSVQPNTQPHSHFSSLDRSWPVNSSFTTL